MGINTPPWLSYKLGDPTLVGSFFKKDFGSHFYMHNNGLKLFRFHSDFIVVSFYLSILNKDLIVRRKFYVVLIILETWVEPSIAVNVRLHMKVPLKKCMVNQQQEEVLGATSGGSQDQASTILLSEHCINEEQARMAVTQVHNLQSPDFSQHQ